MNEPPDRPAGKRVGLRAVAEAAGVSLMTASLALRNSPRLSASTRKRVRDLAQKLGYRPDPELSRLMSRLRPSRKLHGGTIVAMIDLHTRRSARIHPYDAGVRQGIAARADALGFGVALFSLADYNGSIKQLLRVIRHRGITGLILLPSSEIVAFDPAIDWDGLSVVAATTTVTSPQFHQAAPNHLHNITALIDALHTRGFRRVAAVFSASLDARTHRAYSLALHWHGHGERILILPDALPDNAAGDRVVEWIERHRPDALVGGDAMTRALLLPRVKRVTRNIRIFTLTSQPGAPNPYLDQRPQLIGECAVSLLTGMMHNNETGIPADPQLTVIRGVLREPGEH